MRSGQLRPYAEADETSLAIDPNYAPAYSGLGYIAACENDLVSAAQHLERALALDPSPDSLSNVSTFLESLGRLQEALPIAEALVQRDPVNLIDLPNLGIAQLRTGQFDASIASFRTVLNLSPARAAAHHHICVALLFKGDASAAAARDRAREERDLAAHRPVHGLSRARAQDGV